MITYIVFTRDFHQKLWDTIIEQQNTLRKLNQIDERFTYLYSFSLGIPADNFMLLTKILALDEAITLYLLKNEEQAKQIMSKYRTFWRYKWCDNQCDMICYGRLLNQ